MTFTYTAQVAWDSSGNKPVKNASFQAYALTDTGFTTPLAITDANGNPLPGNILNSGSQGVFPQFNQATNPAVVLADPTRTYVWTLNCVPTDAATANFINTAGSQTGAALSASYAPAEPGVSAWAASTAYTVGQIIRNPSGHVVTVLTAHTSTSSYDSTKFSTPLGYMPFGGTPQTTVVKQNGDTRPGVWEMIHDSGTGYLFHLMTGVNSATASALIGLGIDNSGQGIFINNKKTGQGINIQQNNTITSGTAYAIYASQLSTVAPLIHIDQADGTQKSIRIVTSESTDDTKDCFQIISPGTNKGGSILAKSGNIFWWSDIVTHDGGKFRARALQTSQNNDQAMVESNTFRLATYTGSTDQFWHKRVTGNGQSMLFQLADTLAGGPDATVTTWLTGMEIKQVSGISAGTQIGFYGVAPVARAAAIASPASDTSGTKAAIDAIRAALTGIGITF